MLKKIRDFYQKEYEITKQEVAKISLFPVQANVVLGNYTAYFWDS